MKLAKKEVRSTIGLIAEGLGTCRAEPDSLGKEYAATGGAVKHLSEGQPGRLPAARTLQAWKDFSLLRTDIHGWIEMTMVLNELARSMGLPDFYPFVMSRPVVSKLQFVHLVVRDAREAQAAA